jgi:hypothetical protein
MRWARLVAHIGERSGVQRGMVGKPERNHLEDPGVVRKIILRWIFRKLDVGVRTGMSWLRIWTGGGHL